MAADDSARFMIDGGEYTIPTLDTFTMGEALTLYEYSGLTIDEIDEDTGAHPGVVAALMHIAYERGNPGVNKRKARAVVENSNLLEAIQSLLQSGEDDAGPPELSRSSDPETSSPPSSDSSSSASGNGSATASEPPAETPEPTGTPI